MGILATPKRKIGAMTMTRARTFIHLSWTQYGNGVKADNNIKRVGPKFVNYGQHEISRSNEFSGFTSCTLGFCVAHEFRGPIARCSVAAARFQRYNLVSCPEAHRGEFPVCR